MRPSTTPCQSPNADALNGRHGFPPHIRASAGAGFGTGLYTAPFRPRPGIRRYKARPSHAQHFLRLHPGSLAPMRQRPGLRFPIPHLESFPPHTRAALACPLSVDRDGFLSLSLSLTEGNAPPFGPIRGRQRNPPKHCPRPRLPLPGHPVSSRVPPRQAARAGRPVSEDISGRTPDTRQKSCGTLDQEPKRPPRQAAEVPHHQQGRHPAGASPTETRQRQQHLAAIFRGWLAYPDRRQRPAHAERGHAAQRIPLRYAAKAAHKRRASARHRHAPQTCGTGGARPHIKAGGRCRPKRAASAGGTSVLGTEPAGAPAAALRRPSYPIIRERVSFILFWMSSCVESDFWITSVRPSLMLFNESRLARIRS